MDAQDYFCTHEREITSLADLRERADQVGALADATDLEFFWRGQSDARWGVHSSLHRAVADHLGLPVEDVTDRSIVAEEVGIVAEAREWIRPSVGARLTSVDLFARLQHFGAPTRLLDFTREPKVAAYFAVTERLEADGRLIIAAARGAPDDAFRNSFDVPWESNAATLPSGWTRQLYVLSDQADFPRIVHQAGVFLTGGTPSTQPRRIAQGQHLRAKDVRRCMSIPLALHSWVQAEAAAGGRPAHGRRPTVASALTLRIPAAAKASIRADLEVEGWTMERLFPDPEGYRDRSVVLAGLR